MSGSVHTNIHDTHTNIRRSDSRAWGQRGADLGWRQVKKQQGNDHRRGLTLSLEQERTMTPPEASASLSQGFEAVDSPRTRAASFRGGPQGLLRGFFPRVRDQEGGCVAERTPQHRRRRGNGNTKGTLLPQVLRKATTQNAVTAHIPLLHQHPKEVNAESPKPVDKRSEQHYTQEPKGERVLMSINR